MKWFVRIGIAVLALFVVTVAGLWLASNRHEAGRMRGSVEIARAPEDIWPWMTEPQRLTQWVGRLALVEPDTSTPAAGIGHRERWVMEEPRGKSHFRVPTITLWEPPRQMGVHVELPGLGDGDVLYRLQDLGNGRTRVEQDCRFRYKHQLAKLMEPMITPDAMRKMVADLNRLREQVEAMPYVPDPGMEAAAGEDSTGAKR